MKHTPLDPLDDDKMRMLHALLCQQLTTLEEEEDFESCAIVRDYASAISDYVLGYADYSDDLHSIVYDVVASNGKIFAMDSGWVVFGIDDELFKFRLLKSDYDNLLEVFTEQKLRKKK